MHPRAKNILFNFAALLIGCIPVLLMLAAGELYLRCRSSAVPRMRDVIEHNLSDFSITDHVLGMKLLPGYEGAHHVKVNGSEVFSAEYRIDEEGRRITPVEHPESRDKAALFFGCSFTFGQGVEQDETLPACFGRECESLLPVNYAVGGYGPQHLWLQMNDPEFLRRVPRERGVVIYGFFNDHINRLLGNKRMIDDWGGWLPWLSFEDGRVVKHGFMGDRDRNEQGTLNFLKSFHMGRFILKRLGLLQAKQFTDEEGMDGLVAFLLLIKEKIAEILPGYQFVVFSYPWTFKVEGLTERMQAAGIPFFDYTHAYPDQNANQDRYFYRDGFRAVWGHPKAIVYADVAKWLAQDLAEYCGGDEKTIGDAL